MKFVSALISLANAQRDRSTPNAFGYRLKDVLKCIYDYIQQGVNVFILNEGRPFDYEGKEVSVDEFVNMLTTATGFKTLVLPNHGNNDLAFNKIILFSPELMCVGTKGLWPLNGELVNYPQGAQSCQSVFEISFIFNDPSNYNSRCEYIGPEPFKVFAIHDPVAFEGRQQYIEALIKYISRETGPLVCIGDFNFLPDMGGNEQRELLSNYLVNCAPNIGITFKGFPHDINPETGEPWESSLDGVFANEVMLRMFPNYSVETIDTEHKISDHFILIVTFSN